MKKRRKTVPILDQDPDVGLELYLDKCEMVGADRATIKDIALRTIAHLTGDSDQRKQTEVAQKLERQWYDSLKNGSPDWSVYGTDYYLAELWACWMVYSRTYLRLLHFPGKIDGASFIEHAGPINSIIDLGCGVAMTTTALKQTFPGADVVGTNLDGTRQIQLARMNAKEYGFRIETEVKKEADVVFASEYFEHLVSPISHLHEVVSKARPKIMLIANSFGTKAIGHFPCHFIRGKWIDSSKVQKEFGTEMRRLGYRKVKTKYWNSRPCYWRYYG